jgi:hypothetical protein
MALTKKTEASAASAPKQQAAAFMNWSLQFPDGSVVRSSQGLPLFKHAEDHRYYNPQEEMLIRLAAENGGKLPITLQVNVCTTRAAADKTDLSKINLASLFNSQEQVPVDETPNIPLQ